MSLNSEITALLVFAFDRAGVTDAEWQSSLRIGPARLKRLRSETSTLTDAELDRVSQAAGEPWESLVLRAAEEDSPFTADTQDLIGALHALRRTAEAEAVEHADRRKRSAADERLAARFRARPKSRSRSSSKPIRVRP